MQLTITASDAGSPSLTTDFSFTIFIDPVNNNAPYFFDASIILEEDESTNIGTSLIQIYVFDFDAGNSGEVDLSIEGKSSLYESSID